MKCDQDLCLNLRYDRKKLLWQDELNPRVRCAFGNVYLRSCNIASTFSQQAALCPCIRGTRQPTHRPSERIDILNTAELLKVCYRGLLTTLLCSPYEGKEGWEVTAAKWRGTLYLRQQVCHFEWSPSDLAFVFLV